MPSARPRSLGGNTEVTIAAEVADSRAAPPPWMTRLAISQALLMLRPASSEPTVKMAMPAR